MLRSSAIPQSPATRPEVTAAFPHVEPRCVHELFEAQVVRRGQSIAVFLDEESLTYEELNQRANQLAHYLRERGVGPDVLVGVCMERSLDAIVALLGILKAGGAYVPLDPAYPKDRIAYILSDANCGLLITRQESTEVLPAIEAEIILLDANWPTISEASGENLGCIVQPENLAYTIYTSGSTGKPKGVQVEHHSVVNLLVAMQSETGIDETDVVAAVTTLCFDIAGLELYLPLVSGAHLAIVGLDEAADGKKLQTRIHRAGVTLMQGTPALWRLLIETGWPGDKDLKIICGGEAFPRELANHLVSRCHSLWNMYGPTETTIWSSVCRVSGVGEGGVPIGHPIRNTQFHIVDDVMNPVPPGGEGQLLIGGDGVARGYWNRPELSQEKFIPDPFCDVPGARLYKSGDLAKFLPDGNVVYLGRMDHQVKIRGYRIELGEIEFAVASHPSVKQCVVVARENSPGDKRLVAYLVASAGQKPVTRVLREFLRTKLPEYMVPASFVVLDAMPLTPNGKVDRNALPAPTRENSALDRLYVPPRDAMQKQLVSIWEQVIKIKPIGITDNIFELGVDSLLAAQLMARIEMKLAKSKLPSAPLYQAPTIEALCALMRGNEASVQNWTSLIPIQPEGTKTPLFCVHGAGGTVLGFYPLARQLAPERPVYGFRARGLFGRDLPHTTIEDMASHYIEEMRSVQPHGPYLLAGWCFGGIVAFEMAQQLRRVGEQIDLLAMLNAPSTPDYAAVPEGESEVAPLTVRSRQRLEEFRSLSATKKLSYGVKKVRSHLAWRFRDARTRAAVFAMRSTRRLRLRVAQYYVDHRRPMPDFLRSRYFYMVHGRAERQYRHQSYPGDIILFRDRGPYADSNMGWGRFVNGRIETHEMPVSAQNYRTIMQEPTIRSVAEKIEQHVSRRALVQGPSSVTRSSAPQSRVS